MSPEPDWGWARTRPPAEALRWAAGSVGPGSRVVAVRPLGGTWLAVHAIDVRDAAGSLHRLVLRRWARPDWQATDPDYTADREAATLRALEPTPIAAPRLVGVDPDGHHAGTPALLLSRIAGRPPTFAAIRRQSVLAELGRRLAEIHAVDGSIRANARPFEFYHDLATFEPPAASGRPSLWRRAVDLVSGPPSGSETVFLHRDYHPWNTLWQAGQLTGIIDWTGASRGAPGVDLGHLSWNLAAEHDPSIVRIAVDAYRSAGGLVSDARWWNVRMLLDAMPDNEEDHVTGEGLDRVERYLVTLLA